MKKPEMSMFPGRCLFLSPSDRAKVADAIIVRYGASLEQYDIGKSAAVLAAKELIRTCIWERRPDGGIATSCHGRLVDNDVERWNEIIANSSPACPELRYCAFCGGTLVTRGFDLPAGEAQE